MWEIPKTTKDAHNIRPSFPQLLSSYTQSPFWKEGRESLQQALFRLSGILTSNVSGDGTSKAKG
jgi:hypothetical protein